MTAAAFSAPDRPASLTRLAQNLAFTDWFESRGDYDTRNLCVMVAVTEAIFLGMPAGYRIDPEEPEWPVAFIDLPTGQVSWHLQQYAGVWDGHSTDEKYARVKEFVDAQRGEKHDA